MKEKRKSKVSKNYQRTGILVGTPWLCHDSWAAISNKLIDVFILIDINPRRIVYFTYMID